MVVATKLLLLVAVVFYYLWIVAPTMQYIHFMVISDGGWVS
jgi:hypothetical protein